MEAAELIERFGEDCVIAATGDKNEPIAVREHWVYIRKCTPHRILVDTPEGEKEIFRPDYMMDDCNWCEVLAIGNRVGQKRLWSKARRKLLGAPLHIDHCIEVGDIVLVPDTHEWGIKRSPQDEFEAFVDEMVIIAKHEPDGEGL